MKIENIEYGNWQQSIERKISNLQTRCKNLESQGAVDYKTIMKLVDRALLLDSMLVDAAARIKDLQEIITAMHESVEVPEETERIVWN